MINNVYKRTTNIESIEKIFKGIGESYKYSKIEWKSAEDEGLEKPSVRKAATKWIEYTRLKKKLREILKKKGK